MLLKFITFVYFLLFGVTPFLMSSKTSEIFEFSKMMFIYGLTILASFFYLTYLVLYKPKVKVTTTIYSFIAVIVIFSLSFVFSIDKQTSFYGVYGRWNGGILSLISYLILSFIFLQIVTRELVFKILNISFIASVFVVLWGIPAKFQYDLSCFVLTGNLTNSCWTAQFQPEIRMFSTLGQPNWLGSYLVAHFFIGTFFFLKSLNALAVTNVYKNFKNVLLKILNNRYAMLNAFSVLIILMGIFFTGSRSAILSLFLSLIIGYVYYFFRNYRSHKTFYRLLSVALIIILAIFVLYKQSAVQNSSLNSASQVTDSFLIRTIVWEGALKLGINYGVLGTGPETFGSSYFFVKPERHNLTSEWDFTYNKAHNEFLHIFATTGFLGLLAYLYFIYTCLKSILKKVDTVREPEVLVFRYCILMAFTSILITNFFGFSVSVTAVLFFFLPLTVIFFSSSKEVINSKIYWSKARALTVSALSLAAIFFVFSLFQTVNADLLFKKGLVALEQKNTVSASTFFSKASRMSNNHVYLDKLSYALSQLAFLQSFSNDKKVAEELINTSIKVQETAISMSENNIAYLKTKAKNNFLYFQVTSDLKHLKNSIDTLKYVTNLASTDASSFYLLALFQSFYYKEDETYKNKTEFLNSINKALNLRPNYIEAIELKNSISN